MFVSANLNEKRTKCMIHDIYKGNRCFVKEKEIRKHLLVDYN